LSIFDCKRSRLSVVQSLWDSSLATTDYSLSSFEV
jgi:hypothetical protein